MELNYFLLCGSASPLYLIYIYIKEFSLFISIRGQLHLRPWPNLFYISTEPQGTLHKTEISVSSELMIEMYLWKLM